LEEITIASNYIYRGRIINVRQDRVKVKGDLEALREIVEHPGAVAILVLNEQEEVILVRQHRQPFKEQLLEIPAGKLEPGEEPLECAKRELLEETGFTAAKWKENGCFYPSPGFCDEKIYLFSASGLTAQASFAPDLDENIEVVFMPLAEIANLIDSGVIKDGKTIIALQQMLLHKWTK
jgi:ADP-ribose pyrophosphatase